MSYQEEYVHSLLDDNQILIPAAAVQDRLPRQLHYFGARSLHVWWQRVLLLLLDNSIWMAFRKYTSSCGKICSSSVRKSVKGDIYRGNRVSQDFLLVEMITMNYLDLKCPELLTFNAVDDKM